MLIKLHKEGQIDISTTGSFQIHCSFDPSFFPFDKQICTVRVESSRYVVEMQQLHFDTLAFDGFIPNDQWDVGLGESREFNVSFSSGDTYSIVEFDISLDRKVRRCSVLIIEIKFQLFKRPHFMELPSCCHCLQVPSLS